MSMQKHKNQIKNNRKHVVLCGNPLFFGKKVIFFYAKQGRRDIIKEAVPMGGSGCEGRHCPGSVREGYDGTKPVA